ncbi:hypothetical protein IWZ03DRAFT_426045 [Phyllosticta citriasiana]|uniref:DNA glycosylase n=1 Tax=Phyllosticta citriasiana TaxID=595635 RepID=A0ABR1KE75_9PEZI
MPTSSNPKFSPLTPPAFSSLLAQYPSTHHHRQRQRQPAKQPNASPSSSTSTCDCDFRFTTAPALVAGRRKTTNPPEKTPSEPAGYLTIDEVVRLVHWKINHGSFFPSLPKLAASNDAQTVRRVTGEAFALLSTIQSSRPSNPSHPTPPSPPAVTIDEEDEKIRVVLQALTTLTSLRGIGPATASLLLSIADPANTIPFFADELFLWSRSNFHALNPLPPQLKKSVKIKYSVKEYEELVRAVWAVLREWRGQGVTASASDVEMVARVLGALGKEREGEGGEKETGNGKAVEHKREKVKEEGKATKRKRAGSTKASADGPGKKERGKMAVAEEDADAVEEPTASARRRVMPRRTTKGR